MSKNDLVALVHALLGTAAVIASIMSKGQFGIEEQPVKTIGFAAFLLGTLLFAYAVSFLWKAFIGNVDPVGEALVTTGLYRLVRHPVYLAMLVMCVGLAIGLRSLLGLALTAFGPTAVYRARLEEQALEAKYEEEWRVYRDRTWFFFPGIYTEAPGRPTTRPTRLAGEKGGTSCLPWFQGENGREPEPPSGSARGRWAATCQL
jgi:protein-S-isoprenylcysteine O-methyltransferase Ste14